MDDLLGLVIAALLAGLLVVATLAPIAMWRLHRADLRLARQQNREPLWLPRLLAISLTGIAIPLVYVGAVSILRILLVHTVPEGHTVFPGWVATTVDVARGVMALSLVYLFIGIIRNAR